MSQSDRAAQLLSQKLLQGWTMLGESCAHPTSPCNVPLMENRKGDKRIVCVQCNSEFARDGENFRLVSSMGKQAATAPSATAAPSSAPPAKVATEAATTPKSGQTLTENIEETDYDEYEWKPPSAEEMRAIEARTKESQKHSAEIGQKLLQGWTMTADSCGVKECYLPLMKNPKNQELVCVACGPVVANNPQERASPAVPAALPVPVSSALPVLFGAAKSPAPAPAPSAALVRVTAATQTPQRLEPAAQPPAPAAAPAPAAQAQRTLPVSVAPRSEVDALVSSLGALRAHIRTACEQLQKPLGDWWPVHDTLLAFLDELRGAAAELAAHARTIAPTGAGASLPDALSQLSADVACACSALATRQAEASARLSGCQNWTEAAELTHFVSRCSRWIREAREARL